VSTLVLADGRALAYDVHGEGAPVVFFHGAPGSRGLVPGSIEGVQLVVFDRPGYGDSDPLADRGVLDTAPDVAQLLDALGIATARLVAWSGGCPFGAAAAFALGPERIESLALVSGPGPLDEVPGAWEALGEMRGPTAEVAQTDPARATRAIARRMAPFVDDPAAFLGSGRGPDRLIMDRPGVRSMLERQIAAAVRQGAAGIAADLVAMWRPWGFPLAGMAVPTRVFHGALDPDNGADARTYADRIPGAELVVWPERGHMGFLDAWAEVVGAA
jgi:pimeloyl-ACP methyl ester carboxylesterase